MTDEVKVEQIDREAADAAIESFEWQMANFMPAKGESGAACQNRRLREVMADALARHRLAARPAPAEDAVERVELAKRLFWTETMLSEDADRIQDHWRDKWWQDLADMPLSGPGFVRKWLALADAALAAMQPRGEQ